jgi:anaerobic magnesium-protoporphyrin IX monomethyl ester cyclase
LNSARESDSPRVCLVQPHQDINIHPVPRKKTAVLGRYLSLGIAGLASYLKANGFPNVSVIDSASPGMSYDEFRDAISAMRPAVVGFTATTMDWPEVVALARIVKEVDPDAVVVVGGFHLNCYPRESLSFPCVDLGVVGDGEPTILEIVQRVAAGNLLYGIDGTWYRDAQGIPTQARPRKPVEDLDSLPWAARELFPNHLYRAITIQRPFATMTTVRGCPYACRYCGQTGVREQYRARSAESVFEEIRYLKSVGFKELIFFDETFTVNRKHVVELCTRMIESGTTLPWTCRTRVDLVDRELLILMRKSGCKRLQMGIESGSPAVLERMNRNLNLAQVERGFALARELGFETRGYFMLGYLDETPAETEMTIDLACRLRLDWASFSRVLGLPNTPLYETMIQRGVIDGDFWRDYTMLRFGHKVPYVKQEDWLRDMQRKAYRRFYSRPSVLAGKLRDVTSRHRVKEYAQGAQLFFAIQTEANKNVPATMWKRIANQREVKLSEIPEQPLLPSTGGSEHLGW